MTSNYFIVSIKLDKDVGNVEYRIILRNFGGRIMNSLIVHVRLLSVENEARLKVKKF